LRDDKLTLSGTATASEFADILSRVDSGGLTILSEETGMGGSDHMSFINKGVPALFFHSGSHGDYHTPRDTPDLIDYDGLARVADYGSGVLDALLGDSG